MEPEFKYQTALGKLRQEYPSFVLKDLLPNQSVAMCRSINNSLVRIELSPMNRCYENSDYFVDPNGLEFIHFTSVEKAKEILSTNTLRLYDLNFADDPREVVFTAESVGVKNQVDFTRLKSFVYSLSFCSYPLSDSDEHNMWRLYGNDGNGVGLVISFKNECRQWHNFHLSKIHYSNPEKVAQAFTNHTQYFQQLLDDGFENSITQESLILNLLQLFAFHKHSIYGLENEFRLLHRYDEYWGARNRTFTLNRRNQLSSYVELQLAHSLNGQFQIDNTDTGMPLISVDKMVLGYRYSEEYKDQLQESIRDMYATNSGRFATKCPLIEITSLKSKYFT